MACTGTESTLTQCSHNGIGNHDCSHSEDAGVICEGDEMNVCMSIGTVVHTNTPIAVGIATCSIHCGCFINQSGLHVAQYASKQTDCG